MSSTTSSGKSSDKTCRLSSRPWRSLFQTLRTTRLLHVRRLSPARCKVARAARSTVEASGQPALATSVVLHLSVALALPEFGQAQVEFLDVLVVAQFAGLTLEDDPAAVHEVAVVGDAQG